MDFLYIYFYTDKKKTKQKQNNKFMFALLVYRKMISYNENTIWDFLNEN